MSGQHITWAVQTYNSSDATTPQTSHEKSQHSAELNPWQGRYELMSMYGLRSQYPRGFTTDSGSPNPPRIAEHYTNEHLLDWSESDKEIPSKHPDTLDYDSDSSTVMGDDDLPSYRFVPLPSFLPDTTPLPESPGSSKSPSAKQGSGARKGQPARKFASHAGKSHRTAEEWQTKSARQEEVSGESCQSDELQSEQSFRD